MKKLWFSLGCSLLLMTVGCSQSPQAPEQKTSEAPPEGVTGQVALYRMYQMARSWAPDCDVLKLNSIHLTEVPPAPGKAGAWEATFISRSKGSARSYTYSVVEEQGNLHKGVFAGPEQGWSGPSGASAPFLIAAEKVDTDTAYKTALGKAADYDKKNPGVNIAFLLEKTSKYANPTWRVIWGESAATSGFSVIVDAMTGQYLETLH
ncbi:MAG TPA: hypothetical protein VG675_19680 [Bryobacteraceae bacterium]|nr:hypothetical protein [Bryobacteraceae bacterium]